MSPEDKDQDKSVRKTRPRKRMPWWCAYNGLPYSPRWRVAARRSKRPITEVLSVATCLFDTANQAENRGDVCSLEAEAYAAALDMETGDVELIINALESSGWIADGRIATWDDRQTAISEDTTATERKQRQRDREKAEREARAQAAQDQDVTDVTRDIRDVTQSHDREEERRSDQTKTDLKEGEWGFSAPSAETRRGIGFYFDDHIWPAYPQSSKHISRMPAREKFVELVLGGADAVEIREGVERYGEQPRDPAFVKSLLKFLEDQDWNMGEPIGDRSREISLYVGAPACPDPSGEEGPEPSPTMVNTADELTAALFLPDGQRRKSPVFPDHFRRPMPLEGWRTAA